MILHKFNWLFFYDILLSFLKNNDHGVVLASRPLQFDEYFEVRVEEVTDKWQTGLCLGGVGLQVYDKLSSSALPASLFNLNASGSNVWIWCGEIVLGDGSLQTRASFSLDKIQVHTRLVNYMLYSVKNCIYSILLVRYVTPKFANHFKLKHIIKIRCSHG